MAALPGKSARLSAARLVLWGCIVFVVLEFALHFFVAWQRQRPINWHYQLVTLGFAAAAGLALRWLPRALPRAVLFFAGFVMAGFSALLFYDLKVKFQVSDYDIFVFMFSFQVIIFAVGLIVGFKPAFGCAVAATPILLAVGVFYLRIDKVLLPLVLAYAVALPAKMVERLIEESTAELAEINARLSQEAAQRQLAQEELERHRDRLEELVTERTRQIAIFRALADNATSAIAMADLHNKMIYANRACYEMYGYDYEQQDMLGLDVSSFWLPEDVATLTGSVLPQAERGSWIGEARAKRKDGTLFEASLTVFVVRDEQGQAISLAAMIQDVTERKRAAERIKILYEIDRDILTLQSPEAIAQAALGRIRQLIPCQCALLVEFDASHRARLLGVDGPAEARLEDKQDQAYAGCDLAAWPPAPLQPGSRLQVPLKIHNDLVGLMRLDADHPDAFTQDHVTIVDDVATSLAVAIREARLYEQTRRDAVTKAALLKEINHRVKNNLSAIVGLLYVEQRYAGKELPYQAFIHDLISCVQGLAAVHRMLSDSQWSPLLLSELAERIIRTALQALPPGRYVSVDVAPCPLRVASKQTTSLALVINELTTNTIKYALGERGTARITLHIALEGDAVCVEFRDDGPGYPEEVLQGGRCGAGLHITQTLVREELGGALGLANDGGAVSTIRFSLAEEEHLVGHLA